MLVLVKEEDREEEAVLRPVKDISGDPDGVIDKTGVLDITAERVSDADTGALRDRTGLTVFVLEGTDVPVANDLVAVGECEAVPEELVVIEFVLAVGLAVAV